MGHEALRGSRGVGHAAKVSTVRARRRRARTVLTKSHNGKLYYMATGRGHPATCATFTSRQARVHIGRECAEQLLVHASGNEP
eukprot:scaffold54810_cov57-Phaeocystis_antarctica.AAC.1